MAQQGGTVRWIIEADDSKFNEALDKAEKRAQDLGKSLATTDRVSVFGNVQKEAESTSQVFLGLGKNLSSVAWSTFTTGAGAAATALSAFAGKGIADTSFLEKQNISMMAFTGSIQGANQAMSIAYDYFSENPFTRFDVTEATKNLIQFGATTEQLPQKLEDVGKVSLATGANISDLSYTLQRSIQDGRVNIEDLNMLANQGVPIWGAMQKTLGKTTGQLRDMSQRGQITGEMLEKAFNQIAEDGTEAMEQFNKTLERQKDRLSGALASMRQALAGYTIDARGLTIGNDGIYASYTSLTRVMADTIKGTQLTAEEYDKLTASMQRVVDNAGGLEAYNKRNQATADSLKTSMAGLSLAIAPLIEQLANVLPPIFEKIGDGLNFIANNGKLLIPIIGGALFMFGQIGAELPGISGILGNFSRGIIGTKDGMLKLLGLNPLLAGFMVLFGTGLVQAYKNNEDFRTSVQQLFQALGGVAQAVMPTLNGLIKSFSQIAGSKGVQVILTGIVKALTTLANVIASIPESVLVMLITSIATFAAMGPAINGISSLTTSFGNLKYMMETAFIVIRTNPFMAMGIAAIVLVNVIVDLQEKFNIFGKALELLKNAGVNLVNAFKILGSGIVKGFNEVSKVIIGPFKVAIDWLANLPKNLLTIGHNMMVGLVNGLVTGSKAVINFIKSIGQAIVTTLKRVMGIHSPSRVMAELGGQITLGLANGITDKESSVQKAMDSLANNILSLADKVIGNKKDFGIINFNQEYKDWKKVLTMFTVGSEQYKNVLEKMESTRKSANLEIIKLQQDYNSTLDSTIDRVQKMYGVFEKVDFNGGGMDATAIIQNLDKQLAGMQGWAASQEIIAGLDLDPTFIKELQAMGVDAVNELQAIASMSSSELATMNELWIRKQEIASKAATKQLEGLKNETLNQITQLANGIDEETVTVTDVGGRLVASIGEGVYGAMPTLDSAFARLGDYIVESEKEMASSAAKSLASGSAGSAFEDIGQTIPEDLAVGFDAGAEEALQDIKLSSANVSNMLLKVLSGIAIAVIGSKMFKKTGSKLLEGLSTPLTGTLLKIGQAGKPATKAAEAMTKVGVVGESVSSASGELTKGQQAMKTMRSGILNLILLAGAIAALAIALRVAYEAMPEDLAGLAGKILMLGVITAAMGGLAIAADKVKITGGAILKLVAIAGTITALGIAIGVADSLIPENIVTFSAKIANLSIAVLAIGTLASIAGKLLTTIIPGLIAITLISGALIVASISVAAANAVLPNDVKDFSLKVANLAIGIGAITVLATAIGAIMASGVGALIIGAGLVAILAISGAMVAMASSIKYVDNNVPNNIDRVKSKIDLIVDSVSYMTSANMGNLFLNAMNAINLIYVTAVVKGYKKIASDLMVISAIPIDKDMITTKVELIKDVIEKIGADKDSSIFGSIKGIITNFYEAIKTVSVGLISDSYANIAKNLNYIQNVELNTDQIIAKVELIKQIIDKVGATGEQSIIGQISSAAKNFAEFLKTASVGKIVDTYYGIAQKLSEIKDIELDQDAIQASIARIETIIKSVTDPATSKGFLQSIGEAVKMIATALVVENAAKVLNVYASLGETLNKIKDVPTDEEGVQNKINALTRIVQTIVDTKGSGGMFGAIANFFTGKPINEDQINEISRMLKKMSEMAITVNTMQGINADEAEAKVNAIKRVLTAVGGVKDPGDIGNKEWIVNMSMAMLYKMREFMGVANGMGKVGEDTIPNIQKIRNAVWETSRINTEVGDIGYKEHLIGMATSMAYKLAEFSNALNTITSKEDATGIVKSLLESMGVLINGAITTVNNRIKDLTTSGFNLGIAFEKGIRQALPNITVAGAEMQGSVWRAIEARMNDEYLQGQAMARKFAEGLRTQDASIASAGRNMQGALWNAIESKMADEYYQGASMAQQIINGLNSRQSSYWAVGDNVAIGFAGGIQRNMWRVNSAVGNLSSSAIRKLKDLLGIRSPSRVFSELGGYLSEGLAQGIEAGQREVVGAAESLADAVVNALDMSDYVMSPSLDINQMDNAHRNVPLMSLDGEYGTNANKNKVVIQQTNNNYTQYSLEQVNRDLSWELSKI